MWGKGMGEVGSINVGGAGYAGRGSRSGRAGRGFTLIELLVVIAILVLLLGIVSPIMLRIRDVAKDSVCSGNLRALQTAMMQYAASHGFQTTGGDFWGWSGYWVGNAYPEVWWGWKGRRNIEYGQLWPYVNRHEYYLCPTFEKVCRRPPAGAEWRPGVPYGQAYSDWVNQPETIDPAKFEPVRSYSLNEYVGIVKTTLYGIDMAERVWLCDENPWRQLYLQDDLAGWEASYGINNAHLGWDDAPAEYHDGKANCAFGDGHVEMWKPMAVHLNIQE